MTATEVTEHAAFLTEAQRACKKARDTLKRVDLLAAAALLDSPRFDLLPTDDQIKLAAAYGAAMIAQTGALS